MDKRISVKLYRPADRKNYVCEWIDPETGRTRRKSTGTIIKRDAERFADKLARDLNDPHAKNNPRTTWAAFRERVERDFLPEKRPNTRERYFSAMNVFERYINPKLMSGIRQAEIHKFKAACRSAGNADATIAAHLRHLKSILRWGEREGIIGKSPPITIPAGEATARGRALTDAEFEELVATVPFVVGDDRAASWSHLLRGLYLSGLRIGEAVNLTWRETDGIHVDLERQTLIIPGRLQKGKRDTTTPITPDFAEFLRETPESDRAGFVFNPKPGRSTPRLTRQQTLRTIGDIGRVSGIITKGGRNPTAHDLRRSFCTRWAARILPQHLRVLARHASIVTTLNYYAHLDSDATAEAIQQAMAGIAPKIAPTTKKAE